MTENDAVTAAVVVIGNEVLSGRTQDVNVQFLALGLGELGISLDEVRIIADVEDEIVSAVNLLRDKYDYVFTTGGIGPTHDDITTASVSKAFGRAMIRNPEAEAILLSNYKPEDVTEARMKMADTPDGDDVVLIQNPVSKEPGYQVENVFVMAGVPRIMQAMFDDLKPRLKGGAPVSSRSLDAFIPEGLVAGPLSDVQNQFPDIEIGSYPFVRSGQLGTCLVARSADEAALDEAADAIAAMIRSLGGEPNDPTKPKK
ncbi:MAG TPA: competence/damage-inducible protein A [Rhodospirillales bacterium]|nr:competence/damage-inducible protein A [Rhodospirillales bacterium]